MTSKTVGLIGCINWGSTAAELRAHGLKVILPDSYGRDLVDRVIRDELCLGQVVDSSRKSLVDEIGALGLRGAEAIVLGRIELGMVINQSNSPLPIFGATSVEAAAAPALCLAK